MEKFVVFVKYLNGGEHINIEQHVFVLYKEFCTKKRTILAEKIKYKSYRIILKKYTLKEINTISYKPFLQTFFFYSFTVILFRNCHTTEENSVYLFFSQFTNDVHSDYNDHHICLSPVILSFHETTRLNISAAPDHRC